MDFEIAIVGASAAGLYTASELARAGKRVCVFEQRTTKHTARRTLIVTPAFSALVPDLVPGVLLHRIQAMELCTQNNRVRVDLSKPDLIIERSRLIELLAGRAQARGAEIRYGYHFQKMEPVPEGVRLYFRTGDATILSFTAHAVIGADGIRSEVAEAAGIQQTPTVSLVQAEIELPHGWDPTLTKVWFDTKETRYFFWLMPESATHGVVGLIGDERARVNDVLQKFMAQHGLKPLRYQAGTVAMYHPQRRAGTRVGNAPVLLVGDAAGHVKVTTVGGTVSGFLGAAAAVRSILQGTKYTHGLRVVQRELNLHWYMRAVLARLDNSSYDGLTNAVTPAVRHYLSKHTRDELAPSFWRVLILQPGLLAQMIRSVLRLPVRPGSVTGSLSAAE